MIFRLSVPPKDSPARPPPREPAAGQLRAFIAFFDQRLRPLGEGPAASGLSKTERAVLTALTRRRAVLAKDLSRQLGIDQGYLSRIIGRLEARGLAERRRGKDRRHAPLAATAKARALLARIERAAEGEVKGLLTGLSRTAEDDLVSAMTRMRDVLKPPAAPAREEGQEDDALPASALDDVQLRTLRGGDVALVAHRLAVLRQQSKPFDADIDRRLLAKAAAFLDGFDRARDIGWIAEYEGRLAGACLLKGVTRDAAELTLIHVEPELLGMGLARMLLDQCVSFATLAKYTSVAAHVAAGETEIEDALAAMQFRIVRREQTAAIGGGRGGTGLGKTIVSMPS